MNSLGIIVTGWTVVGLIVVWALVCALVVVQMPYLDKKSWHGRLIRRAMWEHTWEDHMYLPRCTCSYWWGLFIAPLKVTLPRAFMCYSLRQAERAWENFRSKVCRDIPQKEEEGPTKAREEYEID